MTHRSPATSLVNPVTISVVIPVYNEANYIGACLRELQQQTVQPHEVIVVDNNSTDATLAIARQFSDVRLLHERRQGQVYARNRGYNAAKGDIIAKLDGDSEVSTDWIQTLQQVFSNPTIDAVSGYITTNEEPDWWGKRLAERLFNGFVFTANRLISGHHMLLGPNMALRRSMWQQIRPRVRTHNSVWEDLDQAILVNRAGGKVFIMRRPMVAISMRRYRDTALQVHFYTAGWYRTFWPYNRLAAILAFAIVPVVWLLIMLLKTCAKSFKEPRLAYGAVGSVDS